MVNGGRIAQKNSSVIEHDPMPPEVPFDLPKGHPA